MYTTKQNRLTIRNFKKICVLFFFKLSLLTIAVLKKALSKEEKKTQGMEDRTIFKVYAPNTKKTK